MASAISIRMRNWGLPGQIRIPGPNDVCTAAVCSKAATGGCTGISRWLPPPPIVSYDTGGVITLPAGFPWNKAELFNAPDAAACPTIIESTYNRNFEIIYPTTNHRLRHWFFEQSSLQWKDGGIFGPTNTAGIPGFIQSTYGAPGNFEVVVRTSNNMLASWLRRWRTMVCRNKFWQ